MPPKREQAFHDVTRSAGRLVSRPAELHVVSESLPPRGEEAGVEEEEGLEDPSDEGDEEGAAAALRGQPVHAEEGKGVEIEGTVAGRQVAAPPEVSNRAPRESEASE